MFVQHSQQCSCLWTHSLVSGQVSPVSGSHSRATACLFVLNVWHEEDVKTPSLDISSSISPPVTCSLTEPYSTVSPVASKAVDRIAVFAPGYAEVTRRRRATTGDSLRALSSSASEQHSCAAQHGTEGAPPQHPQRWATTAEAQCKIAMLLSSICLLWMQPSLALPVPSSSPTAACLWLFIHSGAFSLRERWRVWWRCHPGREGRAWGCYFSRRGVVGLTRAPPLFRVSRNSVRPPPAVGWRRSDGRQPAPRLLLWAAGTGPQEGAPTSVSSFKKRKKKKDKTRSSIRNCVFFFMPLNVMFKL